MSSVCRCSLSRGRWAFFARVACKGGFSVVVDHRRISIFYLEQSATFAIVIY